MDKEAIISPTGQPGYFSGTGPRGAALIMVLASLLALSVVVLGVSEKTARQSRNVSLLLLEYRSSLLARAGLEVGLDLLANMSDYPAGPVHKVQSFVWRERGLSVSIFPCAAKLNLSRLGRTGPSGQRKENAVLEVLAGAGLSAAEMNYLLHWTGVYGAEGPGDSPQEVYEFYALDNLEYSPPGRALTRPEELMLIPGFEEIKPEWIRQYFTVWGDQTGIDINFADKITALALLPELEPYWERLDSFRQTRVITHPNQLLTEMGLDIVTYNTVLPYIILEPELFEIIIEVREGSWYEKHRYIVRKDIINPGHKPLVLVRDILETKPL